MLSSTAIHAPNNEAAPTSYPQGSCLNEEEANMYIQKIANELIEWIKLNTDKDRELGPARDNPSINQLFKMRLEEAGKDLGKVANNPEQAQDYYLRLLDSIKTFLLSERFKQASLKNRYKQLSGASSGTFSFITSQLSLALRSIAPWIRLRIKKLQSKSNNSNETAKLDALYLKIVSKTTLYKLEKYSLFNEDFHDAIGQRQDCFGQLLASCYSAKIEVVEPVVEPVSAPTTRHEISSDLKNQIGKALIKYFKPEIQEEILERINTSDKWHVAFKKFQDSINIDESDFTEEIRHHTFFTLALTLLNNDKPVDLERYIAASRRNLGIIWLENMEQLGSALSSLVTPKAIAEAAKVMFYGKSPLEPIKDNIISIVSTPHFLSLLEPLFTMGDYHKVVTWLRNPEIAKPCIDKFFELIDVKPVYKLTSFIDMNFETLAPNLLLALEKCTGDKINMLDHVISDCTNKISMLSLSDSELPSSPPAAIKANPRPPREELNSLEEIKSLNDKLRNFIHPILQSAEFFKLHKCITDVINQDDIKLLLELNNVLPKDAIDKFMNFLMLLNKGDINEIINRYFKISDSSKDNLTKEAIQNNLLGFPLLNALDMLFNELYVCQCHYQRYAPKNTLITAGNLTKKISGSVKEIRANNASESAQGKLKNITNHAYIKAAKARNNLIRLIMVVKSFNLTNFLQTTQQMIASRSNSKNALSAPTAPHKLTMTAKLIASCKQKAEKELKEIGETLNKPNENVGNEPKDNEAESYQTALNEIIRTLSDTSKPEKERLKMFVAQYTKTQQTVGNFKLAKNTSSFFAMNTILVHVPQEDTPYFNLSAPSA